MLYLSITASWILSRGAQCLYLACSIANLGLFLLMIAKPLSFWPFGRVTAGILEAKFILWPCILGAAVLRVAMWYFWFTFDQSHWMKKTLWFVVQFFSYSFGTPLYYFFGYRRNPALAGRAQP